MKKRKVELSINNRKESIVLPINPSNIELSEAQLNQKVTLLNKGEVNMLGKRGLAATSLSSFFPGELSPFYKYAEKTPKEYVSILKKWKDNSSIVRLIITDAGINLAMTIDNLTFSVREGDEDIYYTIDLSEYRALNVAPVKSGGKTKSNGLKDRPDASSKGKTHTVVSGENLWIIAKKYYGNGAQYTKIYNANKDKIKNPNSIKVGQMLTIV